MVESGRMVCGFCLVDWFIVTAHQLSNIDIRLSHLSQVSIFCALTPAER